MMAIKSSSYWNQSQSVYKLTDYRLVILVLYVVNISFKLRSLTRPFSRCRWSWTINVVLAGSFLLIPTDICRPVFFRDLTHLHTVRPSAQYWFERRTHSKKKCRNLINFMTQRRPSRRSFLVHLVSSQSQQSHRPPGSQSAVGRRRAAGRLTVGLLLDRFMFMLVDRRISCLELVCPINPLRAGCFNARFKLTRPVTEADW